MARPRVVIVGAGFAGLWAARTLARREADVVLVDRNNYHTFFPLLYQVAAAELVPTDIAHSVRAVFRRAPNVTVRMATMTGLDTAGRVVETDTGPIPWDALILGLGSEPAFFGVRGAEEFAFPLRWMSDAIPLRHHVLSRFERAQTADARDRERLLRFVVVGGGPTGVEYAGALSELVHGPLVRDFPAIEASEVSIELVEASDRLLGGMPPKLSRYAIERLRRRHVTVRTDSTVEAVSPDSVTLSGGRTLATDTVVWTAGVQGEPRVASWGLPTVRGGRVPVEPTLDVVGLSDVYVVGDLAYLEDEDGRPLPQVAQTAIQQGVRAAKNVLDRAAGRPATPFRYRDPGMLAVIGRHSAVAHVFGGAFRGWPAWLLWLGIHLAWLIGFRNRALVLLNWGWNYVFFRRSARLILPATGGSPDTPEHGEGRDP